MSGSAPRLHTADILVVDDTPSALRLLTGMLKDYGYRARPVPSGKLALQAAAAEPPDLILLDITMDGMDGYEVCSRLKREPCLADIPVLFISSLTDTMDKVKAFASGGVDFITKPFQFEEVKARVETHLMIRRLQLDLESKYQELRRLQKMQENLTHMIIHDLRSPLTGIKGFLDLINNKSEGLTDSQRSYVNSATKSVSLMVQMINSLLDISRLEAGEMPLRKMHCNLEDLVSGAIHSLGALAINRELRREQSTIPVYSTCDSDVIQRVIANLLGNALKFTPVSRTITVSTLVRNGCARVEVCDTGPGIAPQYLDRIFDKFAQGEAHQENKTFSTGLGLTFCKLAVEAHGGTIGVDSEVGRGSTFWFELPAEHFPASEFSAWREQ